MREGLPNPDNLAGVADSVLDAAITTVTDRVNTRLDSDGLPANPEPLSESFPSPISGLTGILPSGRPSDGLQVCMRATAGLSRPR